MAHKLPPTAHGDTLPAIEIKPKFEGSGEARHIVGGQIDLLLLFDNCARVPVTIPGLDVTKLPPPEVVTERNLKMDFLMARFKDLVITFSGGEYGTVRYKATASAVEFINLTPGNPPSSTPAPAK